MNDRTCVKRYLGAISLSLLVSVARGPLSLAGEAVADSALTGTLSILHGDGLPGSGVETLAVLGLVDETGAWIPLRLESALKASAVGLTSLAGQRVRVTGRWLAAAADASGGPDFEAATIEALDLPGEAIAVAEATTVNAPYVTILCRYADSINVTPHPPSYYNSLMGTAARTRFPSMTDYWREQSYSALSLDGSVVVGWYNLPQPQSYYIPNGNPDFGRLTDDCTAVADADVFFPSFSGINLFFNGGVGCCGWGASNWVITRDGQTKSYGLVWQPPSLQNLVGVAHEMGHSLGDPHSDCGVWEKIGACRISDPVLGCIPDHDLAAYKDLYHGWIPSGRIYAAQDPSTKTITLQRLAQPAAQGYLLARIPIGGSATHFYSVEARRFAGYDASMPGEAVIIQDVDTTRPEPAHIVDADGGDCGDKGAMWTVGERFVDLANGITISVDSASSNSFKVTIHLCSICDQ